MSATITFRGVTLKAAAEGGYQFTPGSQGNARQLVPMARASAMLFKEMAFDGAAHQLTIFFVHATQDTIRARVQAAYAASEGALVVPGYGTFNDCVLIGKPQWGPQQKIKHGATPKYRMPCTMTFIQLAPQT